MTSNRIKHCSTNATYGHKNIAPAPSGAEAVYFPLVLTVVQDLESMPNYQIWNFLGELVVGDLVTETTKPNAT